jgi:hypothetical protein
MQSAEIAVSASNKVLKLTLSLHAEQEFLDMVSTTGQSGRLYTCPTYSMLVISNIPLHGRHPYAGNIYIPAIDVMSLWDGVYYACVDSIAVNNLDFRESDPLFEPRRRPDARYHHQFDKFLAFYGKFPALGLFKSVFGGGDVLAREGF